MSQYDNYLELEQSLSRPGDNFSEMGYATPEVAKMRYFEIGNMMRKVSENYDKPLFYDVKYDKLSIMDLGAGTGNMWKYFWDYDNAYIEFAGPEKSTKLTLIDASQKFCYTAKDTLKDELARYKFKLDVRCEDFSDPNWEPPGYFHIITSCGALDCYEDPFDILRKCWAHTKRALIWEVSINSRQTPKGAGRHIFTIEDWYNFAYKLSLYRGEDKALDVAIIKKFSAIFMLSRRIPQY